MKRLQTLLWAWCGALFPLAAQQAAPTERVGRLPIDMTPYLAGNYGELRPNHFHAGLDFKTQGTIGHPVYAYDDGYVARVAVNAYGYGLVLYVAHPSGLTTVYGHLSAFADSIDARVRAYQLAHEENNPDITFLPDELPVRAGQQIALSGNTGSSGGPHVHFEIRDSNNGEYYDPMMVFLDRIKDTTAPQVRGLYLYPLGGTANGSSKMQAAVLSTNAQGKTTVTRGFTAWGKVGLGLKAYDRMDGTSNIYGVKSVRLFCEDTLVYSFEENNFVYEEHRFTNSVTDYREWRVNRSMIMKSFREPGNHLRMIRHTVNDGVIDIHEERVYHFRYELSDAHGNRTVLPFTIRGVKSALPAPKALQGKMAHYDRPFSLDSLGCRFEIPAGNLYTDYDLVYTVRPNTNTQRPCVSPIYTLGDEYTPLHGYCPLSIDLPAGEQEPLKLYIACLNGGSTPQVTRYVPASEGRPARLTAEVRQLGRYALRRDVTAPTITLLGNVSSNRIAFTIGDGGSGIASWRGTIDGQFVPFVMNAQGQVVATPKRFGITRRGNHSISMTVVDRCGNEAHVSLTKYF